MISFFLFILSAVVIATMLVAKRVEEKRKMNIFLFKLISKGDERTRDLHQKSLHYYSIGKENIYFWVNKQLPLRSRNLWNKTQSFVKEAGEKYMGDIRNTRLLKRSDGISEFFKSISDIEKGNGAINEIYEEREVLVETTVIEPAPLAPVAAQVKTPRKKAAPRKKKLVVVEAE